MTSHFRLESRIVDAADQSSRAQVPGVTAQLRDGDVDTDRLLAIPFVFSQVPLVESQKFLRLAKDWGYKLESDDLRRLNKLGLLVPFYRVDDATSTKGVSIPGLSDDDPSSIARYAREGRVRDPASVPSSAGRRPDAEADGRVDYFYSEWQLLALGDATRAIANYEVLPETLKGSTNQAKQDRQYLLALAALADRYFPEIVGRVTYRSGVPVAALTQARFEIDAAARLDAAQFDSDRLLSTAEWLLRRARTHDPMREWWDVIRYSDHSGWFAMRGAPLEAVWQRIAAEVLLRAHEELAETHAAPPLPDPARSTVRHPLLDRIGPQPFARGLQPSLARLGVSPHAPVLVVVEGETERLHLAALLHELGIGSDHLVRLTVQGTSSDWPHELAKLSAPRLGVLRNGFRDVDYFTVLVVAMDPEGRFWKTPELQGERLRKLKDLVQAEVVAQGGKLTPSELDRLVQVRTWGEHKYELANFSDDDLQDALLRLAESRSKAPVDVKSLREHLRAVRAEHLDIDIVFKRMDLKVTKVALAEQLLPILIAMLHKTQEEDHAQVPMIRLAHHVNDLVNQLSGRSFHLDEFQA